jgi:hypothetical protein
MQQAGCGVDRHVSAFEDRLGEAPGRELREPRCRVSAPFERAHEHQVDVVLAQETRGELLVGRRVERAHVVTALVDVRPGMRLLKQVVLPAENRRQSGVHGNAREVAIAVAVRLEQDRHSDDLTVQPTKGREFGRASLTEVVHAIERRHLARHEGVA